MVWLRGSEQVAECWREDQRASTDYESCHTRHCCTGHTAINTHEPVPPDRCTTSNKRFQNAVQPVNVDGRAHVWGPHSRHRISVHPQDAYCYTEPGLRMKGCMHACKQVIATVHQAVAYSRCAQAGNTDNIKA